ncbi:MAG: GlsB/YeaQ/YmgE family stress response membrane protein [Steroidobacteraceae bacterium]
MNIVVWFVVGALIGWIASLTGSRSTVKTLLSIAAGIGGSVTGGILVFALGTAVGTSNEGMALGEVLVACGSAVLLLTLIANMRHNGRGYNRVLPESTEEHSGLKA